ncbi:MAG TPA: isoprenylcysteine carboxylmethyltransferase family protein [Candidatus Binatia bacterium]|nr:isoprenylcysteine carboxylmethyltransferase family protein [Candidatus Binatia bacterium]
MPVTALVGFVIFSALTFGVRSWIQYRRTGTTGFVGFRGRPGSIEWWAGALFVAALLAAFASPLLQIAGVLTSSQLWDHGAAYAAGLLLFAAGMAMTFRSQLDMGDSWRIGVDAADRTTLVDRGLFGHVRNPIFTAMTIGTFGLLLLVPNVLSLAALVALVVALQLQVRWVEEPYLAAMHGQRYLDYAARTGRFVPGLGRWKPSDAAGAALEQGR